MPRFASSHARVWQLPPQAVYINGRLRRDAYCYSFSEVEGLSANNARIGFPRAVVTDDFSSFEQATVAVYIGNATIPDFYGYLFTSTRQEDRATNRVVFTARSVLSRLDGCRIEQSSYRAERYYPRVDSDGVATNWTLTGIIRDLFDADRMPADWRGLVGLGDIRGLQDTAADPELPDIRLSGSYLQAINQLLAYVPDVGVRERYTAAGKTLLDFYIIGRGRGAIQVYRGATASQGPAQGAFVQAFQRVSDTTGIFNRCIGYGRPLEHMVTCWTGHATAPLEPAWENPATDLFDTETYSEDELAVLADPELATPTSDRFDAARGFIFRRFRLPKVIRENTILQRNLLTDLSGQQLPIQVFRRKHVMPEFTSFPWTATGTSLTSYTMIKGATLDDQGYLTLPMPCLNRYSMTSATEKVLKFVHLFITLTVSETRLFRRPFYDTGIRGRVGFSGLEDDGFVMDYINQGIGFSRVAVADLPDSDGETHDFSVIYFDPDAQVWDAASSSSPVTVEDDRHFLAVLSERAIAERNQSRTTVDVQEFLYRRIHPGDPCRVLNRGCNGFVFTAYAVSHDLVNGFSSVSMSDQRPAAIRPSARMAEGRLAQQHGAGSGAAGGQQKEPFMEMADIVDQIKAGNPYPVGAAAKPAQYPIAPGRPDVRSVWDKELDAIKGLP